MEDRERAIRVVPHLDRGFDEVMSDRALRQLQSQPREGDRVVTGNDALLLDAQDLSQLLRVGGDKGAVFDRGRPGEAGIVSRQIGLCDEAVGGLDISNAASASSLGSRSCKVENIGSERPLASGE
ncbi:hypothetical protein NKJ36_32305 [Mesorhizobium sp. M0142]|uniref:hypothetical protein n=1 Tax=Mesorhizobium sp. M0142 TaxID=2956894 RepID=UPI003335E366